MSNSRGSYATTPENYMKAFDKLPPEIRRALADANHNYVPQPTLTRLRNNRSTVAIELIAIKGWDEVNKAEGAMRRVWGPGHPQAIAGTKSQIARRRK